jgi:poly(hydroxyalkanoate) depolymerase family esterase
MKQVTDTIEQALSSAGLMPRRSDPRAPGMTIEGTAREVDPLSETPVALESAASDAIVAEPTPDAPAPQPGRFLDRSFAGTAGGRAYKVYVRRGISPTSGDPMPMVVMLHGCTQSPDDFAAGTRMNALADERGFIVVYPAQSAQANVQKCWNWFRTEDQVRESGEPAILAGITREVARTYRIDERRIFVAGMSAGAAMAVVLGATYPISTPRSARTRGWRTAPRRLLRPAFGATCTAEPARRVDAVRSDRRAHDRFSRRRRSHRLPHATPQRSWRKRLPGTTRDVRPETAQVRRPAGATTVARWCGMRRTPSSRSSGRCTAPATAWSEAARPDRSPTRAVPTRHAR